MRGFGRAESILCQLQNRSVKATLEKTAMFFKGSSPLAEAEAGTLNLPPHAPSHPRMQHAVDFRLN
jgi:hypothetical protein